MALKIAAAFVSLEVEQSKVGRGLRDAKSRFIKSGKEIGQASGKAITTGIISSMRSGGLAKSFRRIGEIAAGQLAARAIGSITRAFAGSIPAAQEQIAVEKRLNAVLTATGHAAGFTADQLKKQAAELQKVTNFGDETTIASQAILATFKNIGGVNFSKAIESAQDIATVMGGDLQGATLQLGKALNDPVTGLTMLNRVGITFSKEQQKVIKSLQATGDMAGAQGRILAEVASQFGGAARASRDPLLQLKNTMGDVSEELGTALMPLAIDFSKVMVKSIIPGVQQVIEKFSNLKLSLTQAGIQFWNFITAHGELIANVVKATTVFLGFKLLLTATVVVYAKLQVALALATIQYIRMSVAATGSATATGLATAAVLALRNAVTALTVAMARNPATAFALVLTAIIVPAMLSTTGVVNETTEAVAGLNKEFDKLLEDRDLNNLAKDIKKLNLSELEKLKEKTAGKGDRIAEDISRSEAREKAFEKISEGNNRGDAPGERAGQFFVTPINESIAAERSNTKVVQASQAGIYRERAKQRELRTRQQFFFRKKLAIDRQIRRSKRELELAGASAAVAQKPELDAATRREAGRLKRNVRTPKEIFAEEVARLEQLTRSGAISDETFQRAMAGARKNLADSIGDAGDSGTGKGGRNIFKDLFGGLFENAAKGLDSKGKPKVARVPPQQRQAEKLSFIGIEQLSKSIQTSIQPNKQERVAMDQLKVQKKTATEGTKTNKILDQLLKKTKNVFGLA